MTKKLFLLTFLLAFSLLSGSNAQAIGISVKPKEINLEVKTEKEVGTEFLVTNLGLEPGIYEVYADSFGNKIKFEPSTFELAVGEDQLVKVIVKSSLPGFFRTNISVIARPLGVGGIKTATGIKIPTIIDVSGIPIWWWILGAVIICLIDIFTVVLIKRHKKKSANKQTGAL